jgi:hypothetical protein
MSNDDRGASTLDRVIDHAVREMMHVDPRPGLRQRVLHRLNDRPQRGGWLGVGALATAATLAVILVGITIDPSEPQPASPGQVAVQSSAPGALPPEPPTADEKPETVPPAPVETATRAEPTPESVFGPRTDRVRGASTPGPEVTDPLRPVGPIAVSPLQRQGSSKPEGAQTAAPARTAAQLANLKLDVTITDEREGVSLPPKTVTIVTADRHWGRSRSSGPHAVLNVDAQPEILADGRIRVQLTVEYQPRVQAGEKGPLSSMTRTITAIVDEGTRLNVSQSADPASNRTVRVDLLAARLKPPSR